MDLKLSNQRFNHFVWKSALVCLISLLSVQSCSSKKTSTEKPTDSTTSGYGKETPSLSAAATTLDFKIQKQPETHLCWAAVASSVSKFYDPDSPNSVCQIANQVLGMSSCCTNIKPCDKPARLDVALTLTGNGGTLIAGMPSFDIIKNELINKHVICLRVAWRENGCIGGICGHFIVIYGFHDDATVDVADPWPGNDPGQISLTELQDFYRNTGQITHYYKTKEF